MLTQWRKCKLLRVKNPQAGYIFIIINRDGTGHTGFVLSVEGNTIITIEGNSNNDGSREGNEVVRNKRTIKSVTGFIRLF